MDDRERWLVIRFRRDSRRAELIAVCRTRQEVRAIEHTLRFRDLASLRAIDDNADFKAKSAVISQVTSFRTCGACLDDMRTHTRGRREESTERFGICRDCTECFERHANRPVVPVTW